VVEFGAVDEDNSPWLRGVVAEHGWPGSSLVGEVGAHDAWLLAQTLIPIASFRPDAWPCGPPLSRR
jgi:hypothetical protein